MFGDFGYLEILDIWRVWIFGDFGYLGILDICYIYFALNNLRISLI